MSKLKDFARKPKVKILEPRVYLVITFTKNGVPHKYTVRFSGCARCTCPRFSIKKRICKHIRLAQLIENARTPVDGTAIRQQHNARMSYFYYGV